MRTIRSLAFLFLLLGCQATSLTHRRELRASSTLSLESSTNSTEDPSTTTQDDNAIAENNSTVVTNDDDHVTSTDDDDSTTATPSKNKKKHSKSNTTVVVPGQQETDYVNTSISQWDITNKSLISTNHSISNTSTKLLPKERPQSTGWIQTCLGIFLGLTVLLFGLTVHQKYRKRRQYEDAPEMQSLVV